MNHDKQAKTFQHEQGELCPGVIRPKPVAPVPLGQFWLRQGGRALVTSSYLRLHTCAAPDPTGTHTEIRNEVVERGR